MDERIVAEQAKRKEKLLARLQQRYVTKEVSSVAVEKKSRDQELDALLERARCEAEIGVVEDTTVSHLENFLALEGSGWATKRIQNALETLRKVSLKNDRIGHSKSGFSFQIKNDAPPLVPTTEGMKSSTSTEAPLLEHCFTDTSLPDNVIHLNTLSNEDRLVEGVDGADVKLKSLRKCRLRFAFHPSAVHMQDITECTLLFLPVHTSILMHNCSRLRLFAFAQQIRVHTSSELSLHVGVKAAIILESCTQVKMAPYRLYHNGVLVEVPDSNSWRHPNDFDWLAEAQSPNWMVMSEEEWETELI